MSTSEKFWDKTARKYASSPVGDEATYQKKLAETQAYLKPDDRVLEFGCGTGSTAIHHAPCVAHIDAIDIAQNMLEIGREKAREAGIDNITFTRGTLSEFNAASASYDAVLGLNVIHLIADRRGLFEEVLRILKPGGVFVSSTACLGRSIFRFVKFIAPLGKFLGLLPDVFVLTEDELVAEVSNAGFTIESRWHHGKDGIAVFMVARKTS